MTAVAQLWTSCGVQDHLLVDALEDLDVQGVSLKADEVNRAGSNLNTLQGNVDITWPGHRILSDNVQIDESKKSIRADAGATLFGRDIVVASDSLSAMPEIGEAQLRDTRFYIQGNGLRGSAKQVQVEKETIVIEAFELTSCNPQDATWSFASERIHLDRRNQVAVTRNLKLSIASVPVAYLPYLRFPTTGARLSGLLLPAVSRGTDDGLKLKIPVYLNLAPNYDLTLSGSFLSKRGSSLEGEFRHMNSWMRNDVRFFYTHRDRRFAQEFGTLDHGQSDKTTSERRWNLAVEHNGSYRNWFSEMSLRETSDELLVRDVGASIEDITSPGVPEVASLSRVTSTSTVRMDMREFRPYGNWESKYRITPRLLADWHQRVGPFNVSASGSWSNFSAYPSADETTVSRAYSELFLQLPIRRGWGFLDLQAMQSNASYRMTDESESRSVSTIVAHGGLVFERSLAFAGEHRLQTLEPQIYVLRRFAEDVDVATNFDSVWRTESYDSLFSAHRFTGYDRTPQEKSVSVRLNSRILTLTGRDLLNFGVAVTEPMKEIEEQEEPLTRIGIEFRAVARGNWTIDGYLVSPRYENSNVESALRASLQSNDPTKLQLTIGIRQREGRRQHELSVAKNLSERWRTFVHLHRDTRRDRAIHSFAGFGYQGCCLAANVLWRETILPAFADVESHSHRRGIYFEFSLRGLGNIGDAVASIVQSHFDF